jgi:Domain of unknown function (DUF1854).
MPSQQSSRIPLVNLHQHEDEPEIPVASALPASTDEDVDGVQESQGQVGTLRREGDKLIYEVNGREPMPARVAWTLPLSERPGPVSILVAGKKKELAYLDSLDRLDPESRKIAKEELDIAVILPRITEIHLVWPRFGNYYWDTETTKGHRKFLLVSPENNSQYIGADAVIVKDVSGNCYEINPISGLDKKSLKELDKVL